MTAIDPREEKLPKWARAALSNARYEAQVARDRLAEHVRSVEPSPIWYGNHQNRIQVPIEYGYQTVYFSLTGEPAKHSYEEVGIAFRKGTIQVQGGRRLHVAPNASNSFDILPGD